MKQIAQAFESFASLAMFAVVTLAIAGTTYQVFNPDGAMIQWVGRMWDANPTILILVGGIVLLTKRWLASAQSAGAADLLFYGAVMLGLYFGFNLLLAA